MDSFSPEKGIEIFYTIDGLSDGPKLVLIHGLFLNSDCWKFQLPFFKDKFQILRFDLRGHGRSTKPKTQFTIRNYVDDMYALLTHLNWTENLFSRCLKCNARLISVDKEDLSIKERRELPQRVREEQNQFWLCSVCQHIYWEGSHTRRMRSRLQAWQKGDF